jgi:hypothetical protein
MMLPCSPVPLEPSTAIVLKKKSVRRTVRDEPRDVAIEYRYMYK